MRAFLLCSCALAFVSGCAAAIDGTSQTLTIRTAPVGGTCSVQRGQAVLGMIRAAPGTLVLSRTPQDLTVLCEKPGWLPTLTTMRAKPTGVTVGNVFLGGIPGFITDHETHADYRYDDDVTVLLTPPNAPG